MEISTICRYCGGVIRLVSAETVYDEHTERRGKKGEMIYQCQNCGARVGCHKGTNRPLGKVANEMLRCKRVQAHRSFDRLWKRRGMERRNAYRWLAKEMDLSMGAAHIGGFEMDQCQRVIDLCRNEKEAHHERWPEKTDLLHVST